MVGGWVDGVIGSVFLRQKARMSSSQENEALCSPLKHLHGLGFGSGPFLGIWVAKMNWQLGLHP